MDPRQVLLYRLVIPACIVLVLLLSWEYVSARALIHPIFISAPSRIIVEGYAMLQSGELWEHIRVSALEFVLGFTSAVILGLILGIAIGWYRRLRVALDPFVVALYATPRIAFLPLLIIWLGIGLWSKVAVIFLGAIFAVMLNMITAMQNIDPAMLRVARSFGATTREIFTGIALPASVPYLMSGLRLALGRALIGVLVSEMYAANAGIGYLVTVAGTTFQTDKVFVGVLVFASAGLIMTEIIKRMEKRFESWRPQVNEE